MCEPVKIIAILTDKSFNIRDVSVVINLIVNILTVNDIKNTVFIYGMNERTDSNITYYCNSFGVPKEHRIKFEYDNSKPHSTAIGREFLKVLGLNPDEVYIFSDYPNSDSSMLINSCKQKQIPLKVINSDPKQRETEVELAQSIYYTRSGKK